MNPVIANAMLNFEAGVVFWILITFVLFIILLKRFAWGPILGALEQREQNIQESLDAAEKAMKRAEEISRKNDEALKKAEIDAQRMRKQAKEDAEKIRDEIIEKSRSEAEAVKKQTLDSIEQEKQKAMLELRNKVAELAIEATGKILNAEIDQKKYKKLVDDFIGEIPSN
jgi:F-type H+-transporting ATPase subunit b